jgi:hypothetical protein
MCGMSQCGKDIVAGDIIGGGGVENRGITPIDALREAEVVNGRIYCLAEVATL